MLLFNLLGIAESLVKYEPGRGFLHTMNPLTKLAIVISVFGLGIYASMPGVAWYWITALFILACMITSMGGVHLWKELQSRKSYIIAIVLIYGVMNVFFGRAINSGTVLIHITSWLRVTTNSLEFAWTKTLFLLTSMVSFTLLLKATRLSDLTHSMTKIGVPYAIAMMVSTSIRCIPMVTNSLTVTFNAQRARGLDLEKGSARERIMHMGSLLKPLILILLKMVNLMSIVFQSRGLDLSNKKRTHIRELPLRPLDISVMIFSLGGLILVIVLNILGVIKWNYWL